MKKGKWEPIFSLILAPLSSLARLICALPNSDHSVFTHVFKQADRIKQSTGNGILQNLRIAYIHPSYHGNLGSERLINVLPQSIGRLAIERAEKRIFEQLRELYQFVHEKIPMLREVAISFYTNCLSTYIHRLLRSLRGDHGKNLPEIWKQILQL